MAESGVADAPQEKAPAEAEAAAIWAEPPQPVLAATGTLLDPAANS
jgi:hypothetical protein